MLRCLIVLFMLPSCLLAQNKSFSVYFDFGEATLNMEQRMRLLYFVEDSLDKRQYTLELKGYCDFIDNDAFNDSLSYQRAEHVKAVLLANGFKASQVVSLEGFGEKKSSERKSSEAERQQQRRVDIVFTDIKNNVEIKKSTEEVVVAEKTIRKDNILKGKSIAEINVGENLVLENMHFYGGRHQLLPTSIPVLRELLEIMEDNPTLRILIVGHICCQEPGGDGYDWDTKTNDLSVNRAKEVYTYLLRNGINPERINYEGRGSNEKLFDVEVNEMQKTANRRVEIVILGK